MRENILVDDIEIVDIDIESIEIPLKPPIYRSEKILKGVKELEEHNRRIYDICEELYKTKFSLNDEISSINNMIDSLFKLEVRFDLSNESSSNLQRKINKLEKYNERLTDICRKVRKIKVNIIKETLKIDDTIFDKGKKEQIIGLSANNPEELVKRIQELEIENEKLIKINKEIIDAKIISSYK